MGLGTPRWTLWGQGTPGCWTPAGGSVAPLVPTPTSIVTPATARHLGVVRPLGCQPRSHGFGQAQAWAKPASLPHVLSAPDLLCWPWDSRRCPPASEKQPSRHAWGWQLSGQLPNTPLPTSPLGLVGATTGLPHPGSKVSWRGLPEAITQSTCLGFSTCRVGWHPAYPGGALSTGDQENAYPSWSLRPALRPCSTSAGLSVHGGSLQGHWEACALARVMGPDLLPTCSTQSHPFHRGSCWEGLMTFKDLGPPTHLPLGHGQLLRAFLCSPGRARVGPGRGQGRNQGRGYGRTVRTALLPGPSRAADLPWERSQ